MSYLALVCLGGVIAGVPSENIARCVAPWNIACIMAFFGIGSSLLQFGMLEIAVLDMMWGWCVERLGALINSASILCFVPTLGCEGELAGLIYVMSFLPSQRDSSLQFPLGMCKHCSTLFTAKEILGMVEAEHKYVPGSTSIMNKNTHWEDFYDSKWKRKKETILLKWCRRIVR